MKKFVNIKSLVTIAMIALFSVSVVAMAPDKKKNKMTTTQSGPKVKEDYGNTVTLVTSGTGATEDEATRVALRSAIEQAFGTFVSANTTVVNDELVSDAIATVSSGSVLSYDPISSTSQPDAGYQVTIKAVVSINNLVTFATNHGMTTELSGNTFLHNRKLAQLNKKNEQEALFNLSLQLNNIKNLYDYTIETGQPRQIGRGYGVSVTISIAPTENYELFANTIINTFKSLSLSETEKSNYRTLGLKYYDYSINIGIGRDDKRYPWLSINDAANYVDHSPFKFTLRSRLADDDNEDNTESYILQNILTHNQIQENSFEVYDNLGNVFTPFAIIAPRRPDKNREKEMKEKCEPFMFISTFGNDTTYLALAEKAGTQIKDYPSHLRGIKDIFQFKTNLWDMVRDTPAYGFGRLDRDGSRSLKTTFSIHYTERELSMLREISIRPANIDANFMKVQ